MLMRFNNGTLYQMRRVGGHRQRERQCSHPAQIQVKVKQPELVSTRYYSTSQRTSTRLSSLKTISAKPPGLIRRREVAFPRPTHLSVTGVQSPPCCTRYNTESE